MLILALYSFSLRGLPLYYKEKSPNVLNVVSGADPVRKMRDVKLFSEGKTALEIACSRYTGDDKRKRKDEMELLLGGYFVAVYRSVDNSLPARIVSSETFPKSTLPNSVSQLAVKSCERTKKAEV